MDDNKIIREFNTGATRDTSFDKYEYAGFLSPQVLEVFAAYMHECRKTPTGLRQSDNWQKGIPLDVYEQSGLRHYIDLWKTQRNIPTADGELGASMGVLFNVMGWVLERMKADPQWFDRELSKYKVYRAAELAAREAAKNGA